MIFQQFDDWWKGFFGFMRSFLKLKKFSTNFDETSGEMTPCFDVNNDPGFKSQ